MIFAKRSIVLIALLISTSQIAHAGIIKTTLKLGVAVGLIATVSRAGWVFANYCNDRENAKKGDLEAAARLFMHEMPDFEANIKIGPFEAGIKKSWVHQFDKCVIDVIKKLEEIAKKA